MPQVLVEAAAGIPSDAVLSLRLGPTRRQAPLLRGAKFFDVKVWDVADVAVGIGSISAH